MADFVERLEAAIADVSEAGMHLEYEEQREAYDRGMAALRDLLEAKKSEPKEPSIKRSKSVI